MTQEREKEFGEKPLLEKMFAGEDCNALMSALWELAGGRDEIYVWLNGTPKASLVAEIVSKLKEFGFVIQRNTIMKSEINKVLEGVEKERELEIKRNTVHLTPSDFLIFNAGLKIENITKDKTIEVAMPYKCIVTDMDKQ